VKILFWALYAAGAVAAYYFLTMALLAVVSFLLYGRFEFQLQSPAGLLGEPFLSFMLIAAFALSFAAAFLLHRRPDTPTAAVFAATAALLAAGLVGLKLIDSYGRGGFGRDFLFSLAIVYFLSPLTLAFFTHFIGLGVLRSRGVFL